MKGKMDMVVGMQFGESWHAEPYEGKGISCVMLEEELRKEKEHEYLFSVRVGGSQAEHRFVHNKQGYKFRVLPSLGAVDGIDLLLGAGHIIRPDIMRWEMDNYGISDDRVYVDMFAAVVDNATKKRSRKNDSYGRGGYSMGISGTLCAKMKRNNMDNVVIGQKRWKNGNLCEVRREIWDRLHSGQNGMIEGTQGAMLSMNHGYYPHVTSYDTTVPAILGMAGLHWDDLRDVYGVIKVFPSRVAGESGAMAGRPISWAGIEESAGHPISEYRKMQTWDDASFRGYERMTRFDFGEFSRALLLNRPTKLILTHTDWYKSGETQSLVGEIEDTAEEVLGRRCPVAYLRYGEGVLDYTSLTH